MTSDRVYRSALPLDRAWAELRANSGTQFDPEIVAVFEQVVDENGNLRKLDPALESTLNREVHVPRPSTPERHALMAVLPTLEPMAMPVKGAPEDWPVAPAGEERAAITSGDGGDTVVSEEGATKLAPGTRQVA